MTLAQQYPGVRINDRAEHKERGSSIFYLYIRCFELCSDVLSKDVKVNQ